MAPAQARAAVAAADDDAGVEATELGGDPHLLRAGALQGTAIATALGSVALLALIPSFASGRPAASAPHRPIYSAPPSSWRYAWAG